MCRSLGEIIFLCLGPNYIIFLFFSPEITVLVGVSFCLVWVVVFGVWFLLLFLWVWFFFPQENERSEEKEQEEENLWVFVPGTEWRYVYVE